MALTVHGTVAQGFEPVAQAFRANFTDRGEVGAAVAIYQRGDLVVDLWAGIADQETGRAWDAHTMGVLFSATKGLVAIAFLMLEDRGLLDVDKPIGFYWPELGRGDKADITVRMLLNHRSGLSAVDERLVLEDFTDHRKVEGALVRQAPLWKPGTAQGYGATSWGMYTQALFRRIAGETLGTFLQREVFEPLNADVWLGLPEDENARVATLYPVSRDEMLKVVLPKIARGRCLEGRMYRKALFDKSSDSARALLNPSMGKARMNRMNEPFVRGLELPWMNGIGTARGLARVYEAVVTGARVGGRSLVRKSALRAVMPKQSWTNQDRVLGKPLGYSQGFIKEEPHLLSPHEATIGHTGAGGIVGLGDPKHGLGMAYVMNRMDHHIRSPRCIELCRAMYQSLDGWT